MSAYQAQADPTAVVGKRMVAVIIDMGIYFALATGLFFAFGHSVDTGGLAGCADLEGAVNQCFQSGDTVYFVEGTDATIVTAIEFAYLIGIFVLMRGLTGKTPGTLALGLQVVNDQGQPIGIGRGFVRSIAGIVDYIPCCFPLVGTISIFSTKGHRRVGDMAAASYMVGKENAGRPLALPGITPPGAYVPPAGPYAQAQPAAWPTTAPETAPTAPTASPPAAGSEPQWDEARQAYIQWDAAQGAWLQFDQATQTWTRI